MDNKIKSAKKGYKIANINDRQPHYTGNALCVHCSRKWVAIIPVGTKHDCLECPYCKNCLGAVIYWLD